MNNEELKKLEEALPRQEECDLERASRLYKAKTGARCHNFHPKDPLNLTKETREEVVDFLEKVEQSGKWPQQACTTMFFLTPKNVTRYTGGKCGEHQKWRHGSRSIVLIGMQQMDETEELNVQLEKI